MAKQFEYSQQLDHLKMTTDEIIQMLNTKPVEYALIIHDKDEAEPHIHVMVKILSNSKMDAKMVCKWFKDEPQYINIKHSSWENKLAYLCHRTDTSKDKFQYNPKDVIANFDYISKLDEITRQVSEKRSWAEILELINNGTIRDYNVHEYITIEMYSVKKRPIENALEYYRRKVMNDKDRDISVIMISGPAGVGKTTLAKQFCRNQKKSFCVSSSSNDPMQDYKGEDVLILDDIRDDAFKYHDMLKLLDNHTKSTTQSRYSNKAFIGDTIIMTTSKSIDKWYPSAEGPDRDQLYRRIQVRMDMTQDHITTYHYDDEHRRYERVGVTPNIVMMTVKEGKQKLLNIMEGFGIELNDDVKKRFIESGDNDKRLIDDVPDVPF